MRNFIILFILTGLLSSTTAFAQLNLSTESDSKRKSFIKREIENSQSHLFNAQQVMHTKIGKPIDDVDLYKDVKKIAVLGLSVSVGLTDGIGERGEQGIFGISFQDFDALADDILKSVEKAISDQGYSVVPLQEVMNAPLYSSIDYGKWDGKIDAFGKNSWATTPLKSKWMDVDAVNNISSAGSLMTRGDIRKENALKRNEPLQKLTKEVGADAGIIVSCRINIYKGKYSLGFGVDRRSFVMDMVLTNDEPRIVWSSYFKNFVELDISAVKKDTKKELWGKKWGYDLNTSIPALSQQLYEAAFISMFKFNQDQQGL